MTVTYTMTVTIAVESPIMGLKWPLLWPDRSGGVQKYRFSGWIKTHNVTKCLPCNYGAQDPQGQTAEYELDYNSSDGPPPPAPVLPQHSGTIGWTYDSVEFTVPSHVRSIDIQCELRGQGTVWFDDVWFRAFLTPFVRGPSHDRDAAVRRLHS